MSASDVGQIMGISQDAVRKYKRGDREAGVIRIVRIHEALGCSYMSLLDGLDSTEETDSPVREFNVLSRNASGILSHLATQWDGDIEALIVFLGMVANWPEDVRRDFYLQGTIINDKLLSDGSIDRSSLPPGMDYMQSSIGNLYNK